MDGIVEVARKVSEHGIVLDAGLCVKARNRNASCDRCVRACVAGAVSVDGCEVSLDSGACTDCGACVVACPTGALSAVSETQEALLGRALSAADAAGGEMVVACVELLGKASGAVDFTKVASVPCLKSVSPEILVEAVAFAGVERIRLAHASCEECVRAGGEESACANASRACELLTAWGSSANVKVSGKLPRAVRLAETQGYDPNRRLFFSEVRDSAKNVAHASIDTALDGVFEDGAEEEPRIVRVNRFGVLPHGDSHRRAGLLDALDALAERDFAVGGSDGVGDGAFPHGRLEAGTSFDGESSCRVDCGSEPGRRFVGASATEDRGKERDWERVVGEGAWARVSIDTARCNGCRMCAVFCPTGALFKFHTKKGLIGVKQNVRECVACGCCADVCPEGALSLDPGASVRQVAEGEVLRFVLPKPRTRTELSFDGVHVV